jgi:hypothetical protein
MKCHFLNKIKFSRRRQAILFVLLELTIVLFFYACNGSKREDSTENQVFSDVKDFYLFSSDGDRVLSSARPTRFDGDLSETQILDRLGQYLSSTYFAQTPAGEKTNITFDVQEVRRLSIPGKLFRIGIINMIDETEAAKKHFFQGSYGGQATFYMIAATFLQPQNNLPLLDGMILLYNGKAFPEMVHIDFTGLVTPKSIRHIVLQVLKDVKGEL